MSLTSLARRWIDLHNVNGYTAHQYARIQQAIIRTVQKRKRIEESPAQEAEIDAIGFGNKNYVSRRCCACGEPWLKQEYDWAGPIGCYIGHSGACRECYTYHMSHPGPQAHAAMMQTRHAEYDLQKEKAYWSSGFAGSAGAIAHIKKELGR